MNTQREKRRKWIRRFVGILGVVVVIVAVRRTRADTPYPQEMKPLEASGVIQAEQVTVASEFGGLIASIPVVEAEDVDAGQLVVQLDTTMLDAQIEVMQATVDMAEAGLAQARAGARSGQIAVAQAQLAQAQAGFWTAQQAVSDTHILLENPQDINLEIAVTRAQLESAEHQLNQAVAYKDAIETGKEPLDEAYDRFDGGGRERFKAGEGAVDDLPDMLPPEIGDNLPDIPIDIPDGDYNMGDWELHINDGYYTLYKWVNISFPLDATLLPNVWWQSWIGVNAAGAQKDGLEAKLYNLYAQRADPQEMQARADEARSALKQVEAQMSLAQVQIDALETGATAEQIAAIEARVNQAHSGLDALLKQRDMLSLKAPITGTVVDIAAHPGEVAAQGATMLTIADLNQLTLLVYVPQNRLGQVMVDQPVQITVNSFPGRTFTGHVSRIADNAEFTPRNVATKEERVNLVFAVEINVTNEDNALKPGMPVDVVFGGL